MAKITKIQARQILDSRGNPTIEADVTLVDGSLGRAAVPSGASTGKFEAYELRDHDPTNYQGKSVLRAVANVNEIIQPKIVGLDAGDQKTIDGIMIELDGTPNKSRLGANAILSVSLAMAVAQAKSEKKELFQYLAKFAFKPTPLKIPLAMFNIINGGVHVQNGCDFQEFMIRPQQKTKFADHLRQASEIFQTLKQILVDKNLTTTVGDEGGFAPVVSSNLEPLELITEAVKKAGYKPGINIGYALDVAASQLFQNNQYFLKKENKSLSREAMIDYCAKLTEQYPLVSLEDPLSEDDFAGWTALTAKLGNKIMIVGDDLYTTNPSRLQKGIDAKASNAILIKPNQIGTLSETIGTMKLACDFNLQTIVSHRSGDTQDTFIADLAVAMGADGVKFGSLSRSERLAKYDRLLEIEEIINPEQ